MLLFVAEVADFAEEAGSRTLGGRGGVVQLVRQVSGELAERGKLLRLHFHARDLADAAQQNGHAALGHGRDGLQHVGENVFGNFQDPDVADGVAGAAVPLHARVGEQAGELAGTGDKEGDGAAGGAPDVHLSAEHDAHGRGRCVLVEENGAGAGLALYSVTREPKVFIVGETFEGPDAAQGLCDLMGRGGDRRRGGRDFQLKLRGFHRRRVYRDRRRGGLQIEAVQRAGWASSLAVS